MVVSWSRQIQIRVNRSSTSFSDLIGTSPRKTTFQTLWHFYGSVENWMHTMARPWPKRDLLRQATPWLLHVQTLAAFFHRERERATSFLKRRQRLNDGNAAV